MSSAILYLAIVAIWACVLVPRWLRRSHAAPSEEGVLAEQDQAGQPEGSGSEGLADAPDPATQREQGPAAYGDPVAWEDPAAPAAPEGSVAASYSVTAEYSVTATFSAEATSSGAPVGHGGHGGHGDGGGHGAHGGEVAGRRHSPVPMRPPGPAPHIVQARRRTLTLLITITIAAMGSAFVGLTPWWTSIPPFVMLGVYLLLLHEAAHADAENARSWSEAHARATRAARAAQLARERARQAQVAPSPQPTAEIIDISARAAQAGDQLYDQYADAEIRAVGD